MAQEHLIAEQIMAAKEDLHLADGLIRSYLPFIKAEVSRYLNRFVDESDDEVSIGMMAFHEAILSYASSRGSFLNYAAITIKSRLIDYLRTERRHQGIVSLDQESSETDQEPLINQIPSKYEDAKELVRVQATKEEIAHLSKELKLFGLSLSDIADNSPKQDRTLKVCQKVIRYAKEHPEILEELVETRKLPLSKLIEQTKVSRKTIERHRKYIVAMLVLLTNGFDIIRGHLVNVFKEGGNHHS